MAASPLTAGLVAVALMATAGPARAGVEELLRHVPGAVNVLVVVDGKALRVSPLVAAAIDLPRNADAVVLATRLDFADLRDADRVALLDLEDDATIEAIAARDGGYAEEVQGTQAVRSPRNAYIFKLGPKKLGVMYPASRQVFARWARFAQRKDAQFEVSPYLRAAVAPSGPRAPIVMAVDLADTLSMTQVRAALKASPSLSGKTIDLEPLARVLATIKGAVLTVAVGERIDGRLRIDFSEPAGPLAAYAKPLILETLGTAGASIEDIEGWAARVDGRSIVLEGTVTRGGLAKVMSLVTLPTETSATRVPNGSEGGKDAAASKRYLDAALAIEKELDQMKGQLEDRSRKSQALWYDRYAEKIDQLAVLDVDPELVIYGREVSRRYRAIANAMRGVYLATDNRVSSLSYGDRNSDVAARIQRQEAGYAKAYADQLLIEIRTATANTRGEMTRKYKLEF